MIGKALGVLFGTVSGDEIWLIEKKLTQVKQKQQSMAQVVKESESILNVTWLEMVENRESINWIVAYLHDLRQELTNVTTMITTEHQEQEGFLLKYLLLLAIMTKVRQNQSHVNSAAGTCEGTAGNAVHGTPVREYNNPRTI